MDGQRKIAVVGRKLSFAEAEDEDDRYWANASVEERWMELVNLRMMVFGLDDNRSLKIERVVNKRSLYEDDSES